MILFKFSSNKSRGNFLQFHTGPTRLRPISTPTYNPSPSSSLPVSSDFDFSHRLLRFTRNRLSSSLLDLFSPPVLHFITSRCSAPSQLHLPAINSDLHPSASDAVGSILASDAASTSAALHALHFLKVVYFPVLGKVFFTFPAIELDY
ncbi:hypothetical protein LXL04_012012 [Taraxacum kok-saghyz]